MFVWFVGRQAIIVINHDIVSYYVVLSLIDLLFTWPCLFYVGLMF